MRKMRRPGLSSVGSPWCGRIWKTLSSSSLCRSPHLGDSPSSAAEVLADTVLHRPFFPVIRGPQESQAHRANTGLRATCLCGRSNGNRRDPVFPPQHPPELSASGGEGEAPRAVGWARSERVGCLGLCKPYLMKKKEERGGKKDV